MTKYKPTSASALAGADSVTARETTLLAYGAGASGIEPLLALCDGRMSVALCLLDALGGDLTRLIGMDAAEILALGCSGIGGVTARRLAAGVRLGCLASELRSLNLRLRDEQKDKGKIGCAHDAWLVLKPMFSSLQQEGFACLHLDAKRRVSKAQMVFLGSATSVEVHPRDLLSVAIACRAAAIIVAHNHQNSGDPEPSDEDIALTKRLKAASDIIGITLLDHIILGSAGADAFVSLAERGQV